MIILLSPVLFLRDRCQLPCGSLLSVDNMRQIHNIVLLVTWSYLFGGQKAHGHVPARYRSPSKTHTVARPSLINETEQETFVMHISITEVSTLSDEDERARGGAPPRAKRGTCNADVVVPPNRSRFITTGSKSRVTLYFHPTEDFRYLSVILKLSNILDSPKIQVSFPSSHLCASDFSRWHELTVDAFELDVRNEVDKWAVRASVGSCSLIKASPYWYSLSTFKDLKVVATGASSWRHSAPGENCRFTTTTAVPSTTPATTTSPTTEKAKTTTSKATATSFPFRQNPKHYLASGFETAHNHNNTNRNDYLSNDCQVHDPQNDYYLPDDCQTHDPENDSYLPNHCQTHDPQIEYYLSNNSKSHHHNRNAMPNPCSPPGRRIHAPHALHHNSSNDHNYLHRSAIRPKYSRRSRKAGGPEPQPERHDRRRGSHKPRPRRHSVCRRRTGRRPRRRLRPRKARVESSVSMATEGTAPSASGLPRPQRRRRERGSARSAVRPRVGAGQRAQRRQPAPSLKRERRPRPGNTHVPRLLPLPPRPRGCCSAPAAGALRPACTGLGSFIPPVHKNGVPLTNNFKAKQTVHLRQLRTLLPCPNLKAIYQYEEFQRRFHHLNVMKRQQVNGRVQKEGGDLVVQYAHLVD
ncbi:uncharacterized protein LOC119584618 [Penaeus monodon]|uniref:uncharacterized protein LOC119584618 n=1 Tax=Penaeus monodon TaxID=6687 RepID=UPI0018A7A201|nr:uncharacterized protein LOC119584618 [Penaeus monodon]